MPHRSFLATVPGSRFPGNCGHGCLASEARQAVGVLLWSTGRRSVGMWSRRKGGPIEGALPPCPHVHAEGRVVHGQRATVVRLFGDSGCKAGRFAGLVARIPGYSVAARAGSVRAFGGSGIRGARLGVLRALCPEFPGCLVVSGLCELPGVLRKLAVLRSGVMKRFNAVRKYVSRAALVVAGVAGAGSAFAVDPATALEAVGTLSSSSTGFGPVMFGLAIATAGILIGVKWIKRAKGAA